MPAWELCALYEDVGREDREPHPVPTKKEKVLPVGEGEGSPDTVFASPAGHPDHLLLDEQATPTHDPWASIMYIALGTLSCLGLIDPFLDAKKKTYSRTGQAKPKATTLTHPHHHTRLASIRAY